MSLLSKTIVFLFTCFINIIFSALSKGHLQGGFMSSQNPDFRRAANIFLHSLYPPSILHWMRVLGEFITVVTRYLVFWNIRFYEY